MREFIESCIERLTESGCWIWMRSRQGYGYGDFRMNGKHHLAHRAAYEAFVGTIAKGLHVLHRCDVPECCNPAHLFLGTNLDNIKDAVSKGRKRRPGERNGKHLLTENEVLQIRDLCSSKIVLQMDIAKKYGVTKSCVSHIATRRNWGFL